MCTVLCIYHFCSVYFQPIAQIYIDITEHSANVANIKSCIQKKWGTQYILVGGDGVELEECPGTEGLLDFITNLACAYVVYACLQY